MDRYIIERDGQIDFYKVFLPRVNPSLDIDDILSDNNDGVINGNLLEFKLHVTDLNAVLFQCIKYLSALRVKGKPVPANILIIDINAATVWLYRSAPYLADIEKLYFGGASKDNSGFIGGDAEMVLHYDKPLDVESIVALLKECNYTVFIQWPLKIPMCLCKMQKNFKQYGNGRFHLWITFCFRYHVEKVTPTVQAEPKHFRSVPVSQIQSMPFLASERC